MQHVKQWLKASNSSLHHANISPTHHTVWPCSTSVGSISKTSKHSECSNGLWETQQSVSIPALWETANMADSLPHGNAQCESDSENVERIKSKAPLGEDHRKWKPGQNETRDRDLGLSKVGWDCSCFGGGRGDVRFSRWSIRTADPPAHKKKIPV